MGLAVISLTTEGYSADWTVEQLREPAKRIADRNGELMQVRKV